MGEIGQIVRSHHERWDGSGYPDGLRDQDIPLEARIICCCDAFNAMTTTRSYRTAMAHCDAVAELVKNSGTQFDPRIVEALIAVVDRARDVSRRPVGVAMANLTRTQALAGARHPA